MLYRVIPLLLLCLVSISLPAALPATADLSGVLLRNVRHGFVDYDGIRADPAFERYVSSLANTRHDDLDDQATHLAFLINAYNALAIQGILNGYSPSSIFGRYSYFKRRKYNLLGTQTTLDELENRQLRLLGDPRVHFAIVCASLSCPRLSSQVYSADQLESELDAAARAFANDGTRNRFDVSRKIAFLSGIFDRYQADFSQSAGSVQKYLARYVSDPAAAAILAQDGFAVRYVDDDWDLNGVYRGKPR
ncbi:MAG: DUF547 domain-containing protein [Gammaproteobacteria bacterium]